MVVASSSCSPVLLIAGPTATGKTALAVELARRLDGEIVSADSMQVYRGCAIGTAQPTSEELNRVPYHLIGCLEPDQSWSVADWLRAARQTTDDIQRRGKTAIIAGGTGLYFKAWTNGLFETDGAGRSPELRARLETEWDADQGKALWERLLRVDPETAARLHVNDRLRVVRALEIHEATGRALSELQAEGRRRHDPPVVRRFVLTADREELYRRIDERVLEMMRRGFEAEVRTLLARGATESWPAMRALGYPQMLRLARGEMERETAVEETQQISRRYAKQQMVLFRQWPGTVWLDAPNGAAENARAIEKMLEFHPAVGL
jgi:tRNA dimethylallyltransferase